MKWIDYRERLGIGWDDNQKVTALQQKIGLSVETICERLEKRAKDYTDQIYLDYFFTVSENPDYKTWISVCLSVTQYASTAELVSRYIAFANSIRRRLSKRESDDAITILLTSLTDLNIHYEYSEDDDGLFIFPKGAQELDEALVSAPLEWLKDYPKSRTAWVKALKDYTDQTDENASDIADKFRKALEQFMQEFFASGKSLENLLPDYGEYLKKQGVPAEISNDFKKLLNGYTNYMNSYAKHHDGTSRKVLEYIMYETGNVMRLLITLKQEEDSDAN